MRTEDLKGVYDFGLRIEKIRNKYLKVGKNKLARWTELRSFNNVIQPEIGDVSAKIIL